MPEVVSFSQDSAVANLATTRQRRLERHELYFLLAWIVIQGLVNIAIYPFLPQYSDPALNKLAWDLRAVVCRYEERRVTPPETKSSSSVSPSEWTLPYRLMRPSSAEQQRYPLLVFLHGAGECGFDNLRQLQTLPVQMAQSEWRSRFPCFLVAPQCPSKASWGHIPVRESLIAMITELLREFPAIDSRRIYLTGLSMGGSGSWSVAADQPGLFAAVVPICGRADEHVASRLANMPLWAVHGDADTVIPVGDSRRMIAAIRRVGGNPRYTELAGVGHDVWSLTYRDPGGVLGWMFAQSRP